MNITTKQLKQIIKEELESLLKESGQGLYGYLADQGMSEDEIMNMMETPGGLELLNLYREFGFKKLNKDKKIPKWQRTTTDNWGPEEIQTISDYGKYGVFLKRHGPRWEKTDGPQRRGFQTDSWDDYASAAEGIPKIITPKEYAPAAHGDDTSKGTSPGTGPFTNLLEEGASHRAHKIAELMMTGEAQFETVANFIRMGVVPMEDISAAIVEKYNEMLPQLVDLERTVKAGYDSYTDPYADTDVDAIRKANHEIEILKIPFYNVFQFWSWAADPDTGKGMATDIKEEVDKLLDIKELYKIVPGLQYYAHGGEGSGFEDPFFEHKKR